jgi:hypothetical protein
MMNLANGCCLEKHRRFSSVLAAVAFNVFDGFPKSKPSRQGKHSSARPLLESTVSGCGVDFRQALRWPVAGSPDLGKPGCDSAGKRPLKEKQKNHLDSRGR